MKLKLFGTYFESRYGDTSISVYLNETDQNVDISEAEEEFTHDNDVIQRANTDLDISGLLHYMTDYLNEELSRKPRSEVDIEWLKNAIEAYQAGAR